MKKSDLKTGMIVTLRNGEKYMVFLNASRSVHMSPEDVLVSVDGRYWFDLNGVNENLSDNKNSHYDIMKVEQVKTTTDIVYTLLHHDAKCLTNVLWERKEKKRYTYAQLKEILGEEFEIVKE